MTVTTLYKYKKKRSTITSPKMPPEGVEYTTLSRIVADDGMGITDGKNVTICVDVENDQVSNWTDCELPPEPEPEVPEDEGEFEGEMEPPIDQIPEP